MSGLVKVRILLGALTRVEYTKTVEVPESVANDPVALQDLADAAYDETDGGEFYRDEHFWEKGECSANKLEQDTEKNG